MNAQDEDSAKEFADVLVGLRSLSDRIDREGHPGRAWSPRSTWRPLRRPVFWAATAAAAAALILLAVHGARWLASEAPPPAPHEVAGRPAGRAPGPQAGAPEPAEDPFADWSISWSIDPSIPGRLRLDPSSLPIPTIDKATGFEWRIPGLSFPSFDGRSTYDETQQQDPDPGGSNRSGRSGGPVGDGAAAGSPSVS